MRLLPSLKEWFFVTRYDSTPKHFHQLAQLTVFLRCNPLIDNISLQKIFFQYLISPNAELGTTFRLHSITNRDNHIKIIKRGFRFLGKTLSTTIVLGMCKFCTHQGVLKFSFLEGIIYVARLALHRHKPNKYTKM